MAESVLGWQRNGGISYRHFFAVLILHPAFERDDGSPIVFGVAFLDGSTTGESIAKPNHALEAHMEMAYCGTGNIRDL